MWLVGQPIGLALADSSSCLWFSFVVELLVELVWQWDGTFEVAYLGFFHRWFVERRLSCNKDLISLSPAALRNRCELKGSVAEPVATDSAKFLMDSLSNWVMFTYGVTITALWHGHSGTLPTTLFLSGIAVTLWTLWRGHCDIHDPFVCTVGIYMLIGILAGRLAASEVTTNVLFLETRAGMIACAVRVRSCLRRPCWMLLLCRLERLLSIITTSHSHLQTFLPVFQRRLQC